MRLAITEHSHEPEAAPRRDVVWNILTVFILIGMGLTGLFFFMIFQNPESIFNPFPPPAQPAALILPTSTPTLRQLPPTWTVTPTSTSTATPVPPTAVQPTDAVEVTPGALQTQVSATEEPAGHYAGLICRRKLNPLMLRLFGPSTAATGWGSPDRLLTCRAARPRASRCKLAEPWGAIISILSA